MNEFEENSLARAFESVLLVLLSNWTHEGEN